MEHEDHEVGPFSEYGQFGVGKLDLRVFEQGEVWVDRSGAPHQIAEMSEEYVRNVRWMLLSRCEEFHAACALLETLTEADKVLHGELSWLALREELGMLAVCEMDPVSWLHSTLLWRSLDRACEKTR
jgi:hypothetical protein